MRYKTILREGKSTRAQHNGSGDRFLAKAVRSLLAGQHTLRGCLGEITIHLGRVMVVSLSVGAASSWYPLPLLSRIIEHSI